MAGELSGEDQERSTREPVLKGESLMSTSTVTRTHNMAKIDITDLAAVRKAVEDASAIGHWRRIMAIYGDHLPTCAVRGESAGECDCAWSVAFLP